MRALASHPVRRLSGTVRPPGDKSISHRALMLGAVALGRTTVRGLLEGEDVLHTAAALRAMGASIERGPDGAWAIDGVGVGGLHEPDGVLDFGNSGTSARLMTGLLATHPFTSFITGDASLRRRPMQRVIEPLSQFGASFVSRAGGRLPMAIQGTANPLPVRYAVPVPSAQVKSSVLLAGLNCAGETVVIEREATRDHSELMLAHFGASVVRRSTEQGIEITLVGQPDLRGRAIEVPADPSSAAFAVVAACIAADSDVMVQNVGLNPLRAGLFETLREMGAKLEYKNRRDVGGETVADIQVRRADLRGIDVPAARAPSMIDEYPILAVAAACARGRTRMLGLAELRVKESDRLAAVEAGLKANGVKVEAGPDSLTVEGGAIGGGGLVATHMDHRIAMAFLVLGMAARRPVRVDDGAMIDTSFPGFAALMNGLGARIETA